MLENKRDLLPLGSLYLNSKQHDSWVQSIEDEGRRVTIWVNDCQAHCFADALCEAFGIRVPYRRRELLVGIVLHEVQSLSVSRINRNEKILGVSKRKYLPGVKQILYDEVLVIEPAKVQMGILFATRARYPWSKSQLLLEATCKSMEFVEKQRECFRRSFSESCYPLFDAFMEARHGGQAFDFAASVAFIEKHRKDGPK